MHPIHLVYDGGSGGFFALWLILLATDYSCEFESAGESTLEQIFSKHWAPNDMWKVNEVWPDNQKTKNSNIKQKIYFHCNPSPNDFLSFDGIKIAIYTNLKTQRALCELKGACYFYEIHQLKTDLKAIYTNIKCHTWPNDFSIDNFTTMNVTVQKEMDIAVNESYTEFNSVADIINKIQNINPTIKSAKYNDIMVSKSTRLVLDRCDIAVLWQELILSKGQCLLSQLGYENNKASDNFVDLYKKLHPLYIIEGHI